MTTGLVALAHACGAQDIELKVSSYYPEGGGTEWQATVKHRNATLAWSCVIDKDPDKALTSACAKFCGMYPNTPPHRVRKRPRARPRQAG